MPVKNNQTKHCTFLTSAALQHEAPKQPKNPTRLMLSTDFCVSFFPDTFLIYSWAKQLNTQWSHSELGQALASVCFLTCFCLDSKGTSVLISPKDTEGKTWSSSTLVVSTDNRVPAAIKTLSNPYLNLEIFDLWLQWLPDYLQVHK